MSDTNYSLPGMPDWKFSPPDLRHKGGARFGINTSTSQVEIEDSIKRILRGTTSDEASFEAVVQASRNINWRAMLDPNAVLIAPLLNAASAVPATPVSAVPAAGQAITPEQIEEMCEHLKAVYFPLQELKRKAY